jgi:putative transposase
VQLSSVISGANRHDMKLALATMDDIVIKCPKGVKQNMCMDKGYNFPQIERGVRKRGYADHTRHRGEEVVRKTHSAKRWVVERISSWHNRFRKLLVRFEKKKENYAGLVHLANCIITYRAIHW